MGNEYITAEKLSLLVPARGSRGAPRAAPRDEQRAACAAPRKEDGNGRGEPDDDDDDDPTLEAPAPPVPPSVPSPISERPAPRGRRDRGEPVDDDHGDAWASALLAGMSAGRAT